MQKSDDTCQQRQCRACLSAGNELLHIFDEGFRNVLEFFSGLQVTLKDCLPNYVCVECVAVLKRFVEFRELCKRSQEYFKTLEDNRRQQEDDKVGCNKPKDPGVKLEQSESSQSQIFKIEYENETTNLTANDSVEIKPEINESIQGKINASSCEGRSKVDWHLQFVRDYHNNVWGVDCEGNADSNRELKDVTESNRDSVLSESVTKVKKVPNRRKAAVKKEAKQKRPPVKRSRKKVGRVERVDPMKIEKSRLSIEEQQAALDRMSRAEDYLKAPFKCVHCFKYFLFEDNYNDHIRTRHDESIGPHVCPLCFVRFKRQETLRSHAYKHSVIYRCLVCCVTYKTSGIANQHFKVTHEGVPSTHVCHLCGRISKSSGAQGRHMKLMHSGPVVKIQCSLCPSTFLEKADFKTHMRYHSGAKPFKCDICGNAFPYRDIMLRHRLTHSDEKNFYCIPCDLAFRTQRFLDTHLKISPKHGGKKQKFNCVICRTPFEIKSEMLKHKEREHGIKAAPKKKPEGRNHQCDTCGKAFSTKEILRNHIRTHTGERPFSCTTCGSAFTQKAAMRTHVKLVHLNLKRTEHSKRRTKVKDQNMARATVLQHFSIS